MRHAIGFAIAAALALGTTGDATQVTAAQAAKTSDDVVLQWNEIAVATIGAQPPFPSTRFMATVELAVFEAVNAIIGKYQPYLGTVTAPAGASTEAAAITAAHGVLKAFFPAAAATLDQQRDASLAFIPGGQAKTDGIVVGEAAAAAMIAERTADGSTPAQFYLPTNSDPYEWQPTPSCPPAGGAFFHWGNVKPFGVLISSQFRADPPPALMSGEYARDFNEVLALGDINSPNRSQDNAYVARIYAAQPPHQGWNSVARQIINTRDDDITDTARTLALMNMSLADAHITVFESKYFYRTWRPVTAIPRAAETAIRTPHQARSRPSSSRPASQVTRRPTAPARGRPAASSGRPTVGTTRSPTRIRACRASSSLITICSTSCRRCPTPASTAGSISAPIRTRRKTRASPSHSGTSITTSDPCEMGCGRGNPHGEPRSLDSVFLTRAATIPASPGSEAR
jgi:hypothetical protein